MSYVLQIWRTPVPITVADAADICSQFQGERATSLLEYAELASRLVARHPDIGDLDEDDEPGVWTVGSLAANARAPVFGLGVQTHALSEVVPFVLGPAFASHGFRPNGGDYDFVLHGDAARLNVQIALDPSGNGYLLYVCTVVTPTCREPTGLLARVYPEGIDFLVHHQRLAAALGRTDLEDIALRLRELIPRHLPRQVDEHFAALKAL